MLSKTKKSKKAVSVLIGYVLLVSFIVIISGITYTWLKTYVPAQNLECQEGVSIFVKKSVYNSSTLELKVTLKNTGRFNIGGYFIHAKNDSSQELAIIDLSIYLNDSFGGALAGNSVLFSSASGELKSGEEENHIFIIPSALGNLFSITVTPVRFQEFNNRERFVSCVKSRTEQVIGEDIGGSGGSSGGAVCGNTIIESGETCDDGNLINGDGCSSTCQTEVLLCGNGITQGTEQCDDGNTVSGDGCSSTCQTEGTTYCGDEIVQTPNDNGQTETCDDGNVVNGDGCSITCTTESGWGCSGAPSTCTQLCGNSVLDGTEECDGGVSCQIDCSCPASYIPDLNTPPGCTLIGNNQCDVGETCADSDCDGQTAQCPAGVCNSGICVSTGGGAPSCINYCLSLGSGYSTSTCPANNGQCNSRPGDAQPGGIPECLASGAAASDICCCEPAI